MNSQFTYFSQQMAVLAKEYEERCRTLAANMARVKAFGNFCETFHLAPSLRFPETSGLVLRAIGSNLQAAERDALLADIKRHDYEIGDACEEHTSVSMINGKFCHSVSHCGHSFDLVYWVCVPAEGL